MSVESILKEHKNLIEQRTIIDSKIIVNLQAARGTIAKDKNLKIDDVAFDFSGWFCPNSPFKLCAYNAEEDPCSDFCLYCDEPEERK